MTEKSNSGKKIIMSQSKKKRLFAQRGFKNWAPTTHSEKCYRIHPECAYFRGWEDCEASQKEQQNTLPKSLMEKSYE